MADNVTITTEGVQIEGLNGNETICVYATNGTLVSKRVASNVTEMISLRDKGVYIINILSSEKAQAFKVVK